MFVWNAPVNYKACVCKVAADKEAVRSDIVSTGWGVFCGVKSPGEEATAATAVLLITIDTLQLMNGINDLDKS